MNESEEGVFTAFKFKRHFVLIVLIRLKLLTSENAANVIDEDDVGDAENKTENTETDESRGRRG